MLTGFIVIVSDFFVFLSEATTQKCICLSGRVDRLFGTADYPFGIWLAVIFEVIYSRIQYEIRDIDIFVEVFVNFIEILLNLISFV